MSRVAVGGTFNPIHDGHKALLARAHQLSIGGELIIGITSDEMAQKKYHGAEDCQIRKQKLARFMLDTFGARPKIVILNNPFGPTLQEDFDYLVVSPETEHVAVSLNCQRVELGKRPIEIVRVEYELAWDGRPISSTRILKGEIDIHGKLLQHR
jgi:pantetheine-phosphate adenylyltransferase